MVIHSDSMLILAQKSTCSYLKAVNKQDTKKLLGSDISGFVAVSCPHCFFISVVDLERGEK